MPRQNLSSTFVVARGAVRLESGTVAAAAPDSTYGQLSLSSDRRVFVEGCREGMYSVYVEFALVIQAIDHD